MRTGLTTDMWEAVNATWLEARALRDEEFRIEKVRRFLDWVKDRSLLFGGATASTMLRNDAYWFSRLGAFVERADNTARILDVKYNVLLPKYETVGGTLDYYQWTSILRSVSALRAYHWIYRERVKPWLVADLLILRAEMPRSLVYCLAEVVRHLDLLAEAYGTRGECHERLAELGYDNVSVRQGDGYYGWPEHAPFDAIVVTAAASHVPPPLVAQLKPGGRMIIPVGSNFLTQQLVLVTKHDDGSIRTRPLLPVRFVPVTGDH